MDKKKIIDPRQELPPEGDNFPFGFNPRTDSVNAGHYFSGTVAGILLVFGVVIIFVCFMVYAFGRDLDGRYANSFLKPWFDSLKDKTGGGCCADSDGAIIKDVDWSVQGEGQQCQRTPAISFSEYDVAYDGRYCVRYKNAWWLVPDRAVIEEPNRFHQPIIWPICRSPSHVSGADACNDDESSLLFIRCFIPSAMS
jgi:hypothetical protein